MPTLRSLRLLNSVEAGTTSPAQFQTFLTDIGRSAEFSVLLASRGQSRRMAGNTLTMVAIASSPAATNLVFQAATTLSFAACATVVQSPIAMPVVSASLLSLNTLGGNLVSWNLFKRSPFFEDEVRNVLATYVGASTATFPTVTALINSAPVMGDIASSAYAMNAVVASPPTTTLVAASSVAMALVADNTTAITIVAKETAIMPIIANSSIAMTEIVSRPIATSVMAANAGAIVAISRVQTAWDRYLAGPSFAGNLPLVLANMIGVNPIDFPTLNSIIASASALTRVAGNTSAVQALASNSAAMTTLSISPNLGIILSSTIAMGIIGPNTTAMTSFLNSSGAWAGLFASSVAKGFIVASTPLVDAVAGNAALITYLGTLAVTTSATGIPDGNAANSSLQPFVAVPALPSRVLVLSAKEVGIAATFSSYNFGGSVLAGTQAGATLSLSASVVTAHIAGYTAMTWNLQAIGVTAATLPIITFVNMS